jgi:hypothetical protein
MKKSISLLAISMSAAAFMGCTTKQYYTDLGDQPARETAAMRLQGHSPDIDLTRRTSLPVITDTQTSVRTSEYRAIVTPVAPAPTATTVYAPPPPGVDPSSMPPNPQPGECYARVLVPAKYNTITEQVLVQDAVEQVDIIPAQYKTVDEQVLVSEASERLEVVEAEYKTVTEQVMVSPPSYRVEEVPAEYDWIEEQVKVKEATTMWKKGRGPVEKLNGATGEILCLIEVPAEYKTVKRKVTKKPASTRRVEIPAKYEMVTKRVMVKPPSTVRVNIPAEYKMVPVEKVAVPEQKKITSLPARYETITKEVLIAPEQTEWRRILCETNMSIDTIKLIQAALVREGYAPGTADGRLGPLTQAAIMAYQTENNLATGGITYETMKKLGVSPR